jgi:hypothetical protein
MHLLVLPFGNVEIGFWWVSHDCSLNPRCKFVTDYAHFFGFVAKVVSNKSCSLSMNRRANEMLRASVNVCSNARPGSGKAFSILNADNVPVTIPRNCRRRVSWVTNSSTYRSASFFHRLSSSASYLLSLSFPERIYHRPKSHFQMLYTARPPFPDRIGALFPQSECDRLGPSARPCWKLRLA